MKLFTPTQAKIANTKKLDEDITQIAFLTVELKKLRDAINKENDNFTLRMEEQRKLYSEEKERLQNEVRELEAKIAQGEQQMIELLIPVEEYSERAQGTLERSQVKAISLLTREENVSELEELLTKKLDEVGERELQATENEIKIESRLKGIEEESKMIEESHANLNERINTFENSRAQKLKSLEEQENALLVKEQRNREYLESRTKELDEKERGLKDRREALDRAFTELETLKAKYNK